MDRGVEMEEHGETNAEKARDINWWETNSVDDTSNQEDKADS